MRTAAREPRDEHVCAAEALALHEQEALLGLAVLAHGGLRLRVVQVEHVVREEVALRAHEHRARSGIMYKV